MSFYKFFADYPIRFLILVVLALFGLAQIRSIIIDAIEAWRQNDRP